MNGRIGSVLVEIATDQCLIDSQHGSVSHTDEMAKNQYEKRRWPYILTLPLSWALTLWVILKKGLYRLFGKRGPFINTMWFDGLGLTNRKIKEGAASWLALDTIYNHQFGSLPGLGGIVDDFWVGMMNAQAVRNRLKLVKQEIRRAILQFNHGNEVRILSLACGSAQGLIEVMAELKKEGVVVRALLLDISQEALDYSLNLAQKYEVSDSVETIRTSVSKVSKVSQDFNPHIIEMLGLLDYIDQRKAIKLSKKIKESLPPKGIFLTCNIRHNLERHFLQWVIDWPMIYRSPVELAEVVSQAGFADYRLVYEPLRIHGLVVASKTDKTPD